MNNMHLKRLLKEERKIIDHELATYNRREKKSFSLFSRKRLIAIMLVIVIISTGFVYAVNKMGVLEWFIKESNGYLDILERYPEYKLDINLDDNDIHVRVFGFLVDEENIYLYLDGTPSNLYIDQMEILNVNELYTDSIDQNQEEIYYRKGMSSLEEGKKVYKLKPFDIDSGIAEFSISSFKDFDGRIYPVELEFELEFEKTYGRTVNLNAKKDIKLDQVDETITIIIESVKFLPSATYVNYHMTHAENLYIELGDIMINNYKLTSFFLAGDENIAVYHPMEAQDIGLFKWSINSYTMEEKDFERFELTDSEEIIYRDDVIELEASSLDGYLTYTIKDTGFSERDYMYMDMSVYCGDIAITHGYTSDAYYIHDDGSVENLESFIEIMQVNKEKIRTKSYFLKSYDTYEQLKVKDYLDIENDPLELRIKSITKAYTMDDQVTFYYNIFNQIKHLFSR